LNPKEIGETKMIHFTVKILFCCIEQFIRCHII
jgi:hypothetical protein